MRRNKKAAPRLRKTMLGCFTAILILLGLLTEGVATQPDTPEAPALSAEPEVGPGAKPRPIDPQIDGY